MTWLIDLDAAPAVPGGTGRWADEALSHGRIAEIVGAFVGQGDGAGLGDRDLPSDLPLCGGIPDLARLSMGLLLVSDAARAVIETMEPGRHRTWPVALRDRFGAARRTHHGLIPQAAGAALREAGSDVRVDPAMPDLRLPRRATLIPGGRAAVDPARLPDAHLWWDGGLNGAEGPRYLLCSDAAAARLDGLDLPPLRRCTDGG